MTEAFDTVSTKNRHELYANAAKQLAQAELERVAIQPLTETHPGLTITDAYAIQQAGRLIRIERGDPIVGSKIGLTSSAMQEMLGVDQPDFGYLTHRMLLKSGATVAASELIAPRVEAEIAFRLAMPLAGTDVTREQAVAAIGEVAPALEIIDCRIADWRVTIVDTIADNAAAAAAVVGRWVPLGDVDLAGEAMVLTAADAQVEGRGEAVLEHPAEAAAWLARALAEFGEGLAAGDVVLTGAMARALPVVPGTHAHAHFSTLGDVSVSFR
jgi:2-keto-4-pentenoate hydratase